MEGEIPQEARMRKGWGAVAAAATVLSMAGTSSSNALEPDFGATVDGRPYLSGGIGLEERQALARSQRDSGGRSLLACELSGPILLVDLLPGQYVVEASNGEQVLQRRTTVVKGGTREIYFYFDVPAEVLPKNAAEAG
jgi:hypothetical protein